MLPSPVRCEQAEGLSDDLLEGLGERGSEASSRLLQLPPSGEMRRSAGSAAARGGGARGGVLVASSRRCGGGCTRSRGRHGINSMVCPGAQCDESMTIASSEKGRPRSALQSADEQSVPM